MTMMKTTAVVCAIAAAATSFSGAAFAQGRDNDGDRFDRRGDRREARQERRDESRNYQTDRRADRGGNVVRAQPLAPAPAQHAQQGNWSNYQYNYSAPRYSSYNNYPRYVSNYHYAQPRVQYYVGGYVPTSYRQPYYYVNDWRSYNNLYAPPYGHQWVRTDTGDYLLMALATGVIASLILNHR